MRTWRGGHGGDPSAHATPCNIFRARPSHAHVLMLPCQSRRRDLLPAGAAWLPRCLRRRPTRSRPVCSRPIPELYEQASPAVVSITAQSINPYRLQGRVSQSLGSGFIIQDDGLILTNSHVVFGKQSLIVTLDDGSRVPARLVGADPDLRRRGDPDPQAGQGHAPGAEAGRLRQPARGRGRHRHRQPAGAGPDRHARHRERAEPPPAGHPVLAAGAADPDRRADQPGELGRTAAQPLRRGDRHQRRDHSLGSEHRVRDPDRPREGDCCRVWSRTAG